MYMLVLHPCHKTVCFERAKWESEWILAVKGLIRKVWQDNYKPSVAKNPSPQVDSQTSSLNVCVLILLLSCLTNNSTIRIAFQKLITTLMPFVTTASQALTQMHLRTG